jgi:hypothetical protein
VRASNTIRAETVAATLRARGIDVPVRAFNGPIDPVRPLGELAAEIAADLPDALVCYDDQLALALMDALRDVGVRIPDDLGVVGFDGIPFAGIANPRLTTVAVPSPRWAASRRRRWCRRSMTACCPRASCCRSSWSSARAPEAWPVVVRADDPLPESTEDLADLARRGRLLVLETVSNSGAGHIGGPLSAMDLLVALYFRVLRIRPGQPDWPERDRFILSKGHSAIGLYVTMALRGYFRSGSWRPSTRATAGSRVTLT